MSQMRLQVAIAKAGVASRRKAAELIESGYVRVNKNIVKEKGFHVDTKKDKIYFEGKLLSFTKKKYYFVLNKPSGVLSTAKDEKGRRCVVDYITGIRVYPVGRLDKDTTGLIILTNDGDLTYRLTHPKFGIERVYEVKVKGRLGEDSLRKLKNGIMLDDKLAKAEKIAILKKGSGFTSLFLTLREGRKREVRRMLRSVGHFVVKLKRISYGSLRLGNLKEGEKRGISKEELKSLRLSVGLK